MLYSIVLVSARLFLRMIWGSLGRPGARRTPVLGNILKLKGHTCVFVCVCVCVCVSLLSDLSQTNFEGRAARV